jgi:hypothetical protein
MNYLLRRIEDGKFVAMPGSEKSYTNSVRRARVFTSQEQAENNACGNETAVPLESVLEGMFC